MTTRERAESAIGKKGVEKLRWVGLTIIDEVDEEKPPKRRVVGTAYACNFAHTSITLTLECGHVVRLESDAEIPADAACRQCGEEGR